MREITSFRYPVHHMFDTTAPINSDEPLNTWFNGQTTGQPSTAATNSFGALDGVSPKERAAALGIEWLEEAPTVS